jgi:membrane-bound lytic murein transglycosylase B
MMKVLALLLLIASLLPGAAHATRAAVEKHPGQARFAQELAAEAAAVRPDLTRERIGAWLERAEFRQGIIDAMTRPAEAKPWRDYRPIFLTEKRIADGVAFWGQHAKLLESVAGEYGVSPEIIVAIIGVETSYGRVIGGHRVLDALVTLAFYYPPRAPYFRGELKRLLLLPEGTFPKPLDELVGSYAGAMGLGQFMPTSYGTWARDQDGDGQIDLWGSMADVFASVANYFVAHGWQSGEPIAVRAQQQPGARRLEPAGFEPVYSVEQLAQWGYRTETSVDPLLRATLIRLEGSAGEEHWITHQNFFAITRYNRSPLYAMAVTQLAQAIAAGREAEVLAP